MEKNILVIILTFIATVVSTAQESKYGVKSGVMKTVTSVMGQKVDAVLYFDDYGNIECSQTKTVSGGEKIDISTISRDSTMYIVNYSYKQIQEVPLQESINYLHLSPDIIEQYNIRELGCEKVLNLDCVKYSAEISQLGQTTSVIVWVWQGIPLKSITSSNGMEIKVEVIEIQCNVDIDQTVFKIPSF